MSSDYMSKILPKLSKEAKIHYDGLHGSIRQEIFSALRPILKSDIHENEKVYATQNILKNFYETAYSPQTRQSRAQDQVNLEITKVINQYDSRLQKICQKLYEKVYHEFTNTIKESLKEDHSIRSYLLETKLVDLDSKSVSFQFGGRRKTKNVRRRRERKSSKKNTLISELICFKHWFRFNCFLAKKTYIFFFIPSYLYLHKFRFHKNLSQNNRTSSSDSDPCDTFELDAESSFFGEGVTQLSDFEPFFLTGVPLELLPSEPIEIFLFETVPSSDESDPFSFLNSSTTFKNSFSCSLVLHSSNAPFAISLPVLKAALPGGVLVVTEIFSLPLFGDFVIVTSRWVGSIFGLFRRANFSSRLSRFPKCLAFFQP